MPPIERSADVDVHGVGEAIGRVPIKRNFEDVPAGVEKGTSDLEAGRTRRDAKHGGLGGSRGHRTDVLRDPSDPEAALVLDPLEDRAGRGRCVGDDRAQIGSEEDGGERDDLIARGVATRAVKAKPALAGWAADSGGIATAKRQRAARGVIEAGVGGILQDFVEIGELAAERARRAFDDGPRPATALDQPFVLKATQRLAYGKPADVMGGCEVRFGGKLRAGREASRSNLGAQLTRKRGIAGFGQGGHGDGVAALARARAA